MTDGTKEYNDHDYRISVFYDLAKVAVNRLGYSLGHELQRFGATAVAVTPGWLRSEMMLDNWRVTEENWHIALDPAGPTAPPLPRDSPYRSRRGTSDAASPRWPPTRTASRWNQRSVTSAELAREYGFTDIDGRQPDGWA